MNPADINAALALNQRRTAARAGNALSNEIRAELNKSRRCRLLRNNTGFDLERKVRYGLGKGGADLVGVLPSGRAFAIESKLGSGKLSPGQRAWWAGFKLWGGLGGVAGSLIQAFLLLDDAEREDALSRC